MKISDLTKNPENPRTITEAKQKMLLKALRRFGDLSGIVFNRKTKQLVGGHQRRDLFNPETPIVISKKYSKPTKTGTVAEGYFEVRGERFTYREVYWDEHTERAANIAANKGAGEWDPAKLGEWIKDLNGFDVNFDLDLTMFDKEDLFSVPIPIDVAAHSRKPSEGRVEEEEKTPESPPLCKRGKVYDLGEIRLRCAGTDDDLRFCDFIIAKWERKTGLKAQLVRTETKRRPKQSAKVTANGKSESKAAAQA